MFAIFSGNNLVSFWSNKPGDIFFNLTINKLNIQSPSMFYYQINEVPSHYAFDNNKNLIIQEKVVTIVNEEEVISYNNLETKEADCYYNNGIFYKAC